MESSARLRAPALANAVILCVRSLPQFPRVANALENGVRQLLEVLHAWAIVLPRLL